MATQITKAPAADRRKVKSPRGRPTRKRVAEIDRLLVQTAADLFVSQGYAVTAMEAVAAAAGVSKGTLYSRYPAKQDLLRAVVTDRLAAWAASAPVASEDVVAVDECLMREGRSFFRAMREPEIASFDRLIQAEATRFPELAREFHEQGYLTGVSHLARLIERSTGVYGGFPVEDAQGLARVFTSALLGWLRTEALWHEPTMDGAEEFLARTVDLLVGGRARW